MYDGSDSKCCELKENREKLREKCKRLKSEFNNGPDLIIDPSVDEDKKVNTIQNKFNTLSTTLMNVQQSHDKLVDQNRALSLECSSLKDEIKDLVSCHESMLKKEATNLQEKQIELKELKKAKDRKITALRNDIELLRSDPKVTKKFTEKHKDNPGHEKKVIKKLLKKETQEIAWWH